MWNHLRLAVIRGCTTAWQRTIALVSRMSPDAARHEEDNRTDARARFWAGVQEGRREAESNCARRDPT
jgi:hypothetical protein